MIAILNIVILVDKFLNTVIFGSKTAKLVVNVVHGLNIFNFVALSSALNSYPAERLWSIRT